MDSNIIKVKQVIENLNSEIAKYEKEKIASESHTKFITGTISGLNRAKNTLKSFFEDELKGDTDNV